MMRRNKDRQIRDLENIVKYFISHYTFGENEIAIDPEEIAKMGDCELLEHKNLKYRYRLFRVIGNQDYYDNKFVEKINKGEIEYSPREQKF